MMWQLVATCNVSAISTLILGLTIGITERSDHVTGQWAETVGIRKIVYENQNGNHVELTELLDDLVSYTPEEPEHFNPLPLRRETEPSDQELVAPEEMAALPPETIRDMLNGRAQRILSDRTESGYREFEYFCKRYGRAIHQSWFVTTEEPDNILLGYTLEREISEGSFGRVFRASAPDGRTVAIKLLKEEVGRKSDMLRCFRRGVLSMEILANHEVDGMVPYIESSEIPAFISHGFHVTVR